MTAFPPLPVERFQQFHESFRGENSWWRVCARCGGQCEDNKVGSLMPGEKEFIAGWLGLPVEAFQERFLDVVATPLGNVDVVKMKPGCPFLNSKHRCIIAPVKVVLCEVYPVVFSTTDGTVDFSLDDCCPLSRQEDARRAYEDAAVPALRVLEAPLEWYRAVELYDGLNFDYERIVGMRHDLTRCESFPLEMLMSAVV